VPDVHETNPAAERCWGVILRCARAILAHAGCTVEQARCWPFIFLGIVLVHNNVFSFATTPPAIPIVAASKGTIAPFPLRKFKPLLCDCYVQLKAEERFDKLAPRRIKAIHLCYNTAQKGYFVFIPELRRITTVSDIDFMERSFTLLGCART
jgi:hypothetical protein